VRSRRLHRLKLRPKNDKYTGRNRTSTSIAANVGEGIMRRISEERELENVFTAERAFLYKHSPT